MTPTQVFALSIGSLLLALIGITFRRIEQLRLRVLISIPFFVMAAYFGYIYTFRYLLTP